jgi:hypothetical protein
MAPVTMDLSCSSALPFHSSRHALCRLDDRGRGQPGPVRGRAAIPDVDEPLRHLGPQLRQLAGQHDPAVLDDHHVLAQVLDQIQLVAGEQHRRAPRRQAGQQLAHDAHGNRAKPGERLIQHQQAGLVHQRRDQLDPLLVPVRQRLQAVRRPVGQAQTLQPGIHAAGHVPRRAPDSWPRYTSWSRTRIRGYRPRSSGM